MSLLIRVSMSLTVPSAHVVGIRGGTISDNINVPFQAGKSIG